MASKLLATTAAKKAAAEKAAAAVVTEKPVAEVAAVAPGGPADHHSELVKAVVSVEHPNGAHTEVEELVGAVKTLRPIKMLPRMRFGVGMTIKTADFENIKLRVELEVPFEAAELEETYEFCKDWVEGKVSGMSQEINGATAGS